jgi:hypothetical protein
MLNQLLYLFQLIGLHGNFVDRLKVHKLGLGHNQSQVMLLGRHQVCHGMQT